jgi:hypothetical protein
MIDVPSFVVVLTAASPGLGCSTLTANLAVYLRALAEDLPLAVISLDAAFDPGCFFRLTHENFENHSGPSPCDPPADSFRLGQFGIDYLAGALNVEGGAGQFRRWLGARGYAGVLLVDAGHADTRRAQAAIQSADLLLVAVPGGDSPRRLVGVRQAFRAGGAKESFLWLLPSLLQDAQCKMEPLHWLRFAAAERGLQVVAGEFRPEPAVAALGRRAGESILTRQPESCAHALLLKLARQVLSAVQAGPDADCRLRRLNQEGLLPDRARRVALCCPICGRLALTGAVQYLESLPQRRRLLVHAFCLQSLVAGSEIEPFWHQSQAAVLVLGRETVRDEAELKLWVKTDSGYESAAFAAADESGWQRLVKLATGKTLREQFPALVLVYPAGDGVQVLSTAWASECARLRRRMRIELAADLV